MDIGPVTGGTPRPGSVWNYVAIPVCSVPYGPDRMRLLSTVCKAAGVAGSSARPESEIELGDVEYGSNEMDDERADERAGLQDTGAILGHHLPICRTLHACIIKSVHTPGLPVIICIQCSFSRARSIAINITHKMCQTGTA